MRVVLIGPPGSGKGTLSAELVREYGIPHISTGDMFREHITSGDEFGQKIKALLDKGQLVSDDIVIGMVSHRLEQSDCAAGFLFDGFPRTVAQGEALSELLAKQSAKLDAVVLLEASDDVLVRRLCNRRVCSKCGAVYHLLNKPTKVAGVCDDCGGEVVQRGDDTESVIRGRLDVYRKSTEPLVDYYDKLGLLLKFDGEIGASVVSGKVISALQGLR